jgi:hypothetical protein
VVIDLFNRQVVGFAMGERMTRTLVMDALRMAWFRRHPAAGLIFHSDRGSQYASNDYRQLLRDFKMESSMSRKGDCWDNAVTETLFGSLNVVRITKGRTAPRHALRHAAPSQGRGHRLGCILQSPTAPFDVGICQSHGVPTKMACQPNQPGSIVTASRETLNAGKVIDDFVILSTHHFAPAKLDKDRSDIECRCHRHIC